MTLIFIIKLKQQQRQKRIIAKAEEEKKRRREEEWKTERVSNYRVDNLYAQTTWKLAQFYGKSLSALWHICHTWRMRNIL